MIELPLIFLAGLVGTGHCLGMCGPMALSIGSASSGWLAAIGRQIAYTLGRVFTYTVLGAAAGYCGGRVVSTLPSIINLPAILAIVAGLVLIHQGLRATGWTPQIIWRLIQRCLGCRHSAAKTTRRTDVTLPCLAGGIVGSLLRQSGGGSALLAGVLTGLLPCGLLYGMLALATSTHSLVMGSVTMAVFGFGTGPIMGLAGLSGQLLTVATRRRLFAFAAWCLVLTGTISVARGLSFVSIAGNEPVGCPMCTKQ